MDGAGAAAPATDATRGPALADAVPLSGRTSYDAVVAGGGLAGLTLALQLKQTIPHLSVLVLEKRPHPPVEAAHKVGESSVEMASHYFTDVLGLGPELAQEMPKFGLRFFFSDGENRDIAKRLECGPSHFLFVPSFNIDRGRFEAVLARKCIARGIDFLDDCRVTDVTLHGGAGRHDLVVRRGTRSHAVRCRWLLDATGRASLLKKRLGVAEANRHHINAAWFRVNAVLDPDDWSADGPWRSRLQAPRRLSTNHLMGPGYWVWLIPLVNRRTSVGIVADGDLHPFITLNTFERSLAWLGRHEPQCADAVREHLGARMDFLALKDCSYGATQLFGPDRWGLTGEAGTFLDPLYSPGSDFIGLGNGFICELVRRDAAGEDVGELFAAYDRAFRSLFRTFLVTYERQYPIMGNGRIMSTKVIWDFSMYWGGVALLFCRDKLGDLPFMARARPLLTDFALANVNTQAFLRRWAERTTATRNTTGGFIDYAEIPFLAAMNRDLLEPHTDDELIDLLRRNLALAKNLQREIYAEGQRTGAGSGSGAAASGQLRDVFDRLRAAIA